ncbi:Uu.00g109100.m01.CDS01 [Anthostomella pinea]|uniref:Uu.00g109100.m01.CDS01 n=1 Tax=Anthostomella pinea TaxID=933095 RepID=A0AAI8VEJ6_9PEZI|nr:Uu.00g109100.m01.CDS01 [Anthostomella pinea]
MSFKFIFVLAFAAVFTMSITVQAYNCYPGVPGKCCTGTGSGEYNEWSYDQCIAADGGLANSPYTWSCDAYPDRAEKCCTNVVNTDKLGCTGPLVL